MAKKYLYISQIFYSCWDLFHGQDNDLSWYIFRVHLKIVFVSSVLLGVEFSELGWDFGFSKTKMVFCFSENVRSNWLRVLLNLLYLILSLFRWIIKIWSYEISNNNCGFIHFSLNFRKSLPYVFWSSDTRNKMLLIVVFSWWTDIFIIVEKKLHYS